MYYLAKIGTLSVMTLVFIALAGCPIPGELPEALSSGAIRITITSDVAARTILPDVQMEIDHYTVTGVGPDENTFIEENVSVSTHLQINNLVQGIWGVLVQAYNADNILIGEGKAEQVHVTNNLLTQVSITVLPVVGEGTLHCRVSWNDESIQNPQVSVIITDANGNSSSLPVSAQQEEITCTQSLANGYYDVRIALRADGYEDSYYVDTFRILANQTTYADFALIVNPLNGQIVVQITTDLIEPIEIFFTGALPEIIQGQEMTVTAVTDPADVDSYTWFLNGLEIPGEQSNTITLGSTCQPGFYNVTLRVKKGSIISSESFVFTVLEALNHTYKHIIMVYLDGDNNLESYAIADFNEMEAADFPTEDVKIIALFDRVSGFDTSNGDWTGTRLYEVIPDQGGYNTTINSLRLSGMGITADNSVELNMGDGATLSDFIHFCQTSYTAENYSLVLWNHGGGWRSLKTEAEIDKAVCWDETNDFDSLYTSEISSVTSNKDLAVIGFDACLMGMTEVAYQLRSSASIMVASEDTEPGNGWDYTTLLAQFSNSDYSADALSQAIVSSYGSFYQSTETTLSAIDLNQIDGLMTAINIFAENLKNVEISTIQTARNASQSFSDYDYFDLYDFAAHMPEVTGSVNVKTAIENIVLYNWHSPSLVANGLSIYFPQTEVDSDYYTEIDFSDNSEWDAFLTYFVQPMIGDAYEPDDSLSAVINNGLTLTLGERQYHTFHSSEDLDITSFYAEANKTYIFETSPATISTDTVLLLIDPEGTTILAENDDRNLYAGLTYEFETSGTYFLVVGEYYGDIGDYYLSARIQDLDLPAEDSFIVGDWEVTYAWRDVTITTFNQDHTFISNAGLEGVWTYDGSQSIELVFDDEETSNTGYFTSSTTMNGTFVYEESTVTWNAVKISDTPLLYENFDDNTAINFIATDNNWSIENAMLHSQGSNTNELSCCYYNQDFSGDFVYSVDVQFSSGNIGVIFGIYIASSYGNLNVNDGDVLSITSNGSCWYGTYIADDWSGWIHDFPMNTGTDWNNLKIVSEEHIAYYYINNNFIGSTNLYSDSGKVGVMFYDISDNTQVINFDNLIVTAGGRNNLNRDPSKLVVQGDKSKPKAAYL